jgi:DUF2934 family protein
MAEKPPSNAKSKARRPRERRQTGTAGHTGPIPETRTLPPDPQELGRRMTADERVDEASLESMDASDPPAYSATLSGAAQAAERDRNGESREQKIRQRAYELWEEDGRPSGRADEYWHRAEREIAAESAGKS